LNNDVIWHTRPQSFRRALVFGTGFSLLLISIMTAKNMWDYFIVHSAYTNEFSLLIFSAWGNFYVLYLSISFLIVVIKLFPGCLWRAIPQLSNGKIHKCADTALNARLDMTQLKYGISTKLLKIESGQIWIIGLLLLLALFSFLITDFLGLFVELIFVGLFSTIYFVYDITIHRFSIDRNYLSGEGDYPRLWRHFNDIRMHESQI
jgi:hypothetical protein